MKYNTKVTKRVYCDLIAHLVRWGYDISDMLHPTYKTICADKCIEYMNKITLDHEEDFGHNDMDKKRIEDYLY